MKLSPVSTATLSWLMSASAALVVLYIGFDLRISSHLIFTIIFATLLALNPPRRLIEPSSIAFAYYFVWFILTPPFADLHADDNFAAESFYICYGMFSLTLITAIFGARAGQATVCHARKDAPFAQKAQEQRPPNLITLLALYVLATSLLVGVVMASGGFARWISDPGDAFLNRAGSGVYVILSQIATFCLAGLVGYYSYVTKRRLAIFIFLVWLLLTSPVHGSKGLISLILILTFSPWLGNLRLISFKSALLSLMIVGIFFLGLYFRNISWLTAGEAIPYALNYFTTLRNLNLVVVDFHPDIMRTFWLPFNKFASPFGVPSTDFYFDMNHYLTDLYFPTAWEIRATEQWPVEADLYLNFYFFFGLPLIFVFMFIVGRVYALARIRRDLGYTVVSLLLVISIVPHFRGSIFNSNDFYLYPMMILIYFALRRFKLGDAGQRTTSEMILA